MGAVASRLRGPSGAGLAGGLVLAVLVVALLAPFLGADPPHDLTTSNARDTDEGGRGLQLVGLLSTGWGSRRTPRGKTVWFELALHGAHSVAVG